MAAFLTKPFLGAPYASAGSLHSPSLLPSRNIVQLPASRSQLKRLGLTIGSPIKVYSETSQACRPSRAYCLRAMQGGGISDDRETAYKMADGVYCTNLLKMFEETDGQGSGIYIDRETAKKVAEGVHCMNLLKDCEGIDILAYVSQVDKVVLPESLVDHETLTYDQIKGSAIRCPNPEYEEKMIAAIEDVRVRDNSMGGTVTCIVRNFPWSGEPRAFREIVAVLAKGVMSLPSTESFEIGGGFAGTFMTGCEYVESDKSSGTQGGVSNPKTIKMRIAFKSIISISRWKKPIARGHLDFRAVPRAVHLVETIVAQLLFPMLLPTHAVSHEPLE